MTRSSMSWEVMVTNTFIDDEVGTSMGCQLEQKALAFLPKKSKADQTRPTNTSHGLCMKAIWPKN